MFEALKDTIIDRIRDLFCMGSNDTWDKIDPRYQSDVLSRNRSAVHASLDWLNEMQAIDDGDVLTFNRVKACRNVLAHELLSTLGSQGLPGDFADCFVEMLTLLRKIEVWWVFNFEIPTDSDLIDADIEKDEIIPGRVMMIQLVLDIALGDEERSRSCYNAFRQRSRSD